MTPAVLRRILRTYPIDLQPQTALRALGNAGGASGAALWRYHAGRGEVVLRMWPEDGPHATVLERIHHWLGLGRALGFIPVPYPDRVGRTFQAAAGRLWELAPWMPGAPELDRPPSVGRVRTAFRALAAFHQALAAERCDGLSPGLAARLGELDGWLAGGFDALNPILARAGSDPVSQPARRWCDLARALAPRVRPLLERHAGLVVPLQPCLRDARPEHFLFEADRLSGLVDFGAMGTECVAADLARLAAEWLDTDESLRREALRAYEAVRPLAANELALIAVFEASAALLGGGRWARWRFVEHRRFESPETVRRGLERCLSRVAGLAALLQSGKTTPH